MREKVLILETNAPLADLWRAYLAKNGFDVKCLLEGSAAQEDADAAWGFPDVIVSGLEFSDAIPSGDDYCLRALKAKPGDDSHIPVIQLYAAHLSDSAKSSLKGSAFKLVRKPIGLPALLDAVRKACFKKLSSSLQRSVSPSMTAELSSHALAGILQSIDSEGKSGVALVESSSGNAFLSFSDACLLEAECGALSGEEAALETLSWDDGSASLYETKPSPPKERAAKAEIKSILAESIRQRAATERMEKMLSSPFVVLQRNPSAKLSGKAPFSELVYIALDSPCDFASLQAKARGLTKRQLLVALNGMLEREELLFTESPGGNAKLTAQACRQLLLAIRAPEGAFLSISAPPSIGVAASSPQLAKRFIGATCGCQLSSSSLLSTHKSSLLLSELCACGEGMDSLAGLVVLFDRADSSSLQKTGELLKELASSKSKPFCVAVPNSAASSGQGAPTTAELLSLESSDVKIVHFDWTQSSCISVVKALLESALEKESQF